MTDDLFRVVIAPGFNDGLGGVTMVDGVSTPTSLLVATRIALNLGGRVIRADEEPRPAPSPVEVAPASPPPSAALPSEPAPPDAPAVSPAHTAPPAPSPLPPPPPRPFAPTHRRR